MDKIQKKSEMQFSNNQQQVQEKIIEELKKEDIEGHSDFAHGSELSGITENNISEDENDVSFVRQSKLLKEPSSNFI